MLQIPLQPGYVAAIFFIAIDVVSIAFVDHVLCRLSNAAYYFQIWHAKPVRIKSVDIPGVTNFLLDRYLSPLNIVFLLFKLAVVLAVFFINFNIDGIIVRDSYQVERSSTYDFDPSEDNLKNNVDRNVSRRPEDIGACQKFDSSNPDTLVFYRIAFGVFYSPAYDPILNENVYLYEVNDSLIQCLSPDFVPEDSVMPLVTIAGCSNLTNPNNEQGRCLFAQTLERPFTGENVYFVESSDDEDIYAYLGGSSKVKVDYFELSKDSVAYVWPEYHPAKVHCISIAMGPDLSGELYKRYRKCMIVSQKSGQTLVELWKLSFDNETAGRFTRSYAGPVFDRPVDVSILSAISAMLRPADIPWNTLSQEIVSFSALYQERRLKFRVYDQERVATTIPKSAVIVGGILLGLSFIAVLSVNSAFRRDDRPRLNTIDGLSSIAREEAAPTKSSRSSGTPVLIGWKKVVGGQHLGPLLTERQAIKYVPRADAM